MIHLLGLLISLSILPPALGVSTHLENVIKQTEGVITANYGPNCWNLALLGSGLTQSVHFTHPNELSFFLSSPLCRERKTSEPLRAGDIVAIRHKGSEVHAFIHIDGGKGYSKNGYKSEDEYGFYPTSYIFQIYGVTSECGRVNTGNKRSRCRTQANYFTCEPFDHYVRKNKVSESAAGSLALMTDLELTISKFALRGISLSDYRSLQVLKDKILGLKIQSENESINIDHNEAELLIWKALSLRALSLLTQLDDLTIS